MNKYITLQDKARYERVSFTRLVDPFPRDQALSRFYEEVASLIILTLLFNNIEMDQLGKSCVNVFVPARNVIIWRIFNFL